MKYGKLTTIALASTAFLSTACSTAKPLAARSADRALSSTAAIQAYESDAGGFNTRNFFYDNGEEVVVFDTQFTPDLARKSIDFIRTRTAHPITTVVITHPNPDKFNGMEVFRQLGAKVITSRKTAEAMPGVHAYKKFFFVNVAKMFSEDAYPKLSAVDVVFDGAYDLRLRNGETVALRELGRPGVSSNQTVALIPRARAAIVGDLVHHGVHAWLEGGIVNGKPVPTLGGWIADLRELRSRLAGAPDTIVYGGRGEPARLDDAVSAQIAYLEKADAIVTKYVAALGERKAELSGERAGEHYAALQKEFERVFPGHGLGYMIEYGVYGLLNAKAE